VAEKEWRCAFCRKKGTRSTEHVIPEWLSAVIPGQGPVQVTREELDKGDVQEWSHPSLITIVNREICEDCNTGWMSDLENRAKGIVTALVLGKPAYSAIAATRITLAAWVAKTVAMYDRAHAEPWYVPDSHLRSLYERRHPSVDSFIWLYACDLENEEGTWGTTSMQRGRLTFAGPDVTDGYLITGNIGHLAFQVGGYLGPEQTDATPPRPLPPLSRQAWPLVTLPFEWPPPFQLKQEGVAQLASLNFV
jgi:hypothetical protein